MESLLQARGVLGKLPAGFGKKPDIYATCFGEKQNFAPNAASVESPTIIVICSLKSQ